jgi:hypothetical protein
LVPPSQRARYAAVDTLNQVRADCMHFSQFQSQLCHCLIEIITPTQSQFTSSNTDAFLTPRFAPPPPRRSRPPVTPQGTWAGSAALGGVLIDRYGIVFAFHVTAAMQAAALLPLLFAHAMGLVPAEAADASGGASADVGAEGCGGGRADADDADARPPLSLPAAAVALRDEALVTSSSSESEATEASSDSDSAPPGRPAGVLAYQERWNSCPTPQFRTVL